MNINLYVTISFCTNNSSLYFSAKMFREFFVVRIRFICNIILVWVILIIIYLGTSLVSIKIETNNLSKLVKLTLQYCLVDGSASDTNIINGMRHEIYFIFLLRNQITILLSQKVEIIYTNLILLEKCYVIVSDI